MTQFQQACSWFRASLSGAHCYAFLQITVFASLILASRQHASALTRQIFDGAHHYADQSVAYMDRFTTYWGFGFYYGRSEGRPPSGPSPVPGPAYGSTDVDDMYDLVPSIHQFYVDTFGRNGINGAGGAGDGTHVALDVYRFYVNYNRPDLPVAFAADNHAVGLRTGNTRDWDLLGHEMNHNLTVTLRQNADQSFIGLSKESIETRSLDEGLGDIFGESLERYMTGANDWKFIIGTENLLARDLADPPSVSTRGGLPHVDRYLSPDFHPDQHHVNAGIITKAAYLASEGGSFNGVDVAGIGFDKVERIFFHALTNYFEPEETFNMAYGHILQAAQDLYTPSDAMEVTLALQAVEMHLTRSIETPGDFDGNGQVDGHDFLVWQRGVGSTDLTADGNHDGTVSELDLAIWRSHFGEGISGPSPLNTSVPEPNGILLGLAALILTSCSACGSRSSVLLGCCNFNGPP